MGRVRLLAASNLSTAGSACGAPLGMQMTALEIMRRPNDGAVSFVHWNGDVTRHRLESRRSVS